MQAFMIMLSGLPKKYKSQFQQCDVLVVSEHYRVTDLEDASQVLLSRLPNFTSEERERLDGLQIVSERTGTKPMRFDS